MIQIAKNLNDLQEVATSLLTFAGNNRIFVFRGQMGAGKTTFIKALCKQLGITDTVSSPTFSLVNEYSTKALTVYHFDFYRINSEEEAYDFGYEDYFYGGHYCFIEWPEKIPQLLPKVYVNVALSVTEQEERVFEFSLFS